MKTTVVVIKHSFHRKRELVRTFIQCANFHCNLNHYLNIRCSKYQINHVLDLMCCAKQTLSGALPSWQWIHVFEMRSMKVQNKHTKCGKYILIVLLTSKIENSYGIFVSHPRSISSALMQVNVIAGWRLATHARTHPHHHTQHTPHPDTHRPHATPHSLSTHIQVRPTTTNNNNNLLQDAHTIFFKMMLLILK